MRERLSRTKARLADIEHIEQTSSDVLEGGFTTLNQIKYLIRSNAYLSGIASQECERLLSELNKLRLELETRDKEGVERKAGRIESTISKIEIQRQWMVGTAQRSDQKGDFEHLLLCKNP